jgi:hypothetical protein
MDADLRRLIRESYPFPIAHAHKKLLACLDDAHKLKCISSVFVYHPMPRIFIVHSYTRMSHHSHPRFHLLSLLFSLKNGSEGLNLALEVVDAAEYNTPPARVSVRERRRP